MCVLGNLCSEVHPVFTCMDLTSLNDLQISLYILIRIVCLVYFRTLMMCSDQLPAVST